MEAEIWKNSNMNNDVFRPAGAGLHEETDSEDSQDDDCNHLGVQGSSKGHEVRLLGWKDI